ncbi:MAG: HNH endonuclease [Sphingomonadales bacterium]
MADYPYNTARWQRLRASHLRLSPLCIGCEAVGRITVANTVDHVLPVSAGGPAFPGHDGLASYCPACHSAKTARGEEAGAAITRKPRKGCDVNGNPLDPAHPWNAEKSLGADADQTARGHFFSISFRG